MRIPQYRDPLHFDVLGLGAGGGGAEGLPVWPASWLVSSES